MQRLQMWLHRDHQSLLQLLQWLAECDPNQQESACQSVLRRMHRHTDAHLCIEDELLFPLIERDQKRHDIMMLRAAHGRIRHAIGKLNGAMINRDWPRFRIEARQLYEEFQTLQSYEQQKLSDLIALALSAQDQDVLWQSVLAIRQRVGLPLPKLSESSTMPCPTPHSVGL
ncbi:MAG TPA: hemerythrin domain-containing protein [Permianibacter sp.]|nr:hemerythrin domain-containing protein [Permianibacter sp.]